jgi:hypothetical protein
MSGIYSTGTNFEQAVRAALAEQPALAEKSSSSCHLHLTTNLKQTPDVAL